MKHLKYITLMLLVVLSAACEQMQLPEANLEIKREKVTDITDQSAVIEVEFYPIDATIQKVEACYTKVLKKDMVHVSGFKYRVELSNLNSDTEYQVYYKVKNAFSSVIVKNFGVFRTAKKNKPSNVIDTVYHIDFRQTIGAWTVRNYMLPEGIGYVWRKTDLYGMMASAYVAGTNHASEAWLISSPLDLTSNTTAFLTFNQAYKYGDISQIAVKITTNGLDWTTLEVPVWPDGTSWLVINSGEIDITKYISATTQIAFAYTSSAEASLTWEIRDVLIKGNGTRLEEPATSVTVPTVVTSAVTQITETTAVAGGNVTSDGGASVTERGVVYSTSANPTTANSKVTSGSGTGAFACNLTDLQPNTTYYVRAYAKNDLGIAYGDEVSFTTKEEVIATPEYVDLGLSVKWATFNVGANKPEEYGDYFAWGETEPKSTYDWSTYKWCNGSLTTMTKYCTSSSYGTVDNKKTLELSDDAAYANWGGSWRMPTKAEQDELREKCTWTWTTQNGVNGYKVTGTNGNSIFLPAAGYRYNSSLSYAGSNGRYWSSSLYTDGPYNACLLGFSSSDVGWYHGNRYYGRSVRPVYGQQKEDTNNETYFSVSETKKVTFSKGNLQYHPANNKWRFAENQTDHIGDANSNCSSTYNGWLDLFGWSTSATNFGVSISTNNSDYSGSFVDWGTNQIGNDAPNTWRTLTDEEWRYLLNTRTNASYLKAVAQVDGVNGLIFLPDNWVCPAGVTFKSGFHSSNGVDYYAAYQTFTADQWSKLEAAGAVFLPAAGFRRGSSVENVQSRGLYWSATEYNSNFAYCLGFYSDEASTYFTCRYRGLSVRLVKDL